MPTQKYTVLVFDLVKLLTKYLKSNKSKISSYKETYLKIKPTITSERIEINNEEIGKKNYYWLPGMRRVYFEKIKEEFDIKKSIESILKKFKIPPKKFHQSLDHLMDYILVKVKRREIIDDKKIKEIAEIFVNDLKETPPTCKIKLWVTGVKVEEKIKINDQIFFREPVEDDFIYYIPKNSFFTHNIFYGEKDRYYASTIIEINKKLLNFDVGVAKYIENLIKILYLYNFGKVEILDRDYEINSILKKIPLVKKIQLPSDNNKRYYEIKKNESKNINTFISIIIKFLDKQEKSNDKNNNDIAYLFLSIDRYIDSINDNKSLESAIATTVTALEALFLVKGEKEGIVHKLSQRVAFISKYFSSEPAEVFKDIKDAYSIRSDYVHGSFSINKNMDDSLEKTLKYLRYSILIFLGFSLQRQRLKKETIIKDIDNSILDDVYARKFYSRIKKFDLIKLTKNNTRFNYYLKYSRIRLSLKK